MSPFSLAGALCLRNEKSSSQLLFQLAERLSAALLLIILLPALLLLAGTIRLLSRRAPVVAHLRIGRFGQPFRMLKLRSMWPCGGPSPPSNGFVEYLAEDTACEPKLPRDARVTSRFGAFCRRYSIDELPQLWHVLLGTMSFVGPRPVTAHELREYYGDDALVVLLHKPGISGLWQVMGRSRLTYRQRKRLDLLLVRRSSLSLYLSILVRTVPAVVRGKSAW